MWRFFDWLVRTGAPLVLIVTLVSVRGALACRDEGQEESRVRSIERPGFEALIAALRVYEAGIPSMAWEQSMQQFSRVDGSRARAVTTWSADLTFARDGRWRSVVRQAAECDSLYFDRSWVYARGSKASARVVRAHQTEAHQYLLTPLMLITGGRDAGGVSPYIHMLSDDLAKLQEVEVDDSAAPLIRLSGSRCRGDKWERLEVTLDSERGYMPTTVVVIDEMWDVVRNEYRVSAAERVGESWIPREGTRQSTTLQPTERALALAASPEGAKFQADLEVWQKASAIDLGKRSDRKRFADKMIKLGGGVLFAGKPVGGVELEQLRAWNFRVLDDALTAELLQPPFDEGDKVYDSRVQKTYFWRGGKLVTEDGAPAGSERAAPELTEPKPAVESS